MSFTPNSLHQSLLLIFEGTALIGTYTDRKTLRQSPAIAIGNVPNDVDVKGLEFVIANYPEVPIRKRAGRFKTHKELRWCLDIIQHDRLSIRGKGDLFTATNMILAASNVAQATNVPQANPLKDHPRTQIKFTFFERNEYRNIGLPINN